MAEEEREWRKTHAHEAQIATYGSTGIATYDENTKRWHFLRNIFNNENGTYNPQIFRVLTGHELVVNGTDSDRVTTAVRSLPSFNLIRCHPQTASADSVIAELVRDKTTAQLPPEGKLFGQGRAKWLGVDGQDSGNLTISISAFIRGSGQDELVLCCSGKTVVNVVDNDGVVRRLKMPSFIGTVQASWFGRQRLLQIAFSCSNQPGDKNTLLAVRQASRTTIFEPYLRRDEYFGIPADRSSLDFNPLLSLDRAVTGGQDHVDICFHPREQWRLAVVDVHGNWSTWKITGQRQNTARKLHRAHLEASGKIFSWQHKSRPAGVELYFDGWHKILWVSSNAAMIDRVFVCNRQHAKVFDLSGTMVCWVDVRLDTSKNDSFILDIETGPISNICYVLTTSSILIFDFAQNDWKDVGSRRGPALLCAIPHYFSSSTLQLTTLNFTENISMLAIYGLHKNVFKLFNVEFATVNQQRLVTVINLSMSESLGNLPRESIKSMQFQPVETVPTSTDIVQLSIHYDDLSVSCATLELPQLQVADSKMQLPPVRSSQSKSGRFVDNMEDEDDLADFIIPDPGGSCPVTSSQSDDHESTRPDDLELQVVNSQYLQQAFQRAVVNSSDLDSIPDIQVATEAFELTLDELSRLNSVELLSDIFVTNCRMHEIEAGYSAVERSLDMTRELTANKFSYSSFADPRFVTLLDGYEDLFTQFVQCLPPCVSDRTRVARERRNRGIALELNLSTHTVRQRTTVESSQADNFTAAPIESDPLMFSDPLHQQQRPIPSISEISASQPTALVSETASGPSAQPSPLPGILSRLSAYTTISHPPAPVLIKDENISKQMNTIMSHLPISIDVDPSTYDWQSAELAAVGLDTSAITTTSGARGSRRHDKLADASKRSGKLAPLAQQTRLKKQNPGLDLPPITLPLGQPRNLANIQHPHPVSDSHNPGSSQTVVNDGFAPGNGGFTSTQPERGVFGSRVDIGKPKKKKRRIAGF